MDCQGLIETVEFSNKEHDESVRVDALVMPNLVISDIVMTPPNIAKRIIEHFNPEGTMLEPCRGDGAFWQYMPGAKWCEIREGRDFFHWTEPIDWIITNPPFSNIEEFMKHAFFLAKNTVFLIPAHKPFSSWRRMRAILKYGGIKELILIKGQQCNFPFRYPYGIFHFQKGYNGGTKLLSWEA